MTFDAKLKALFAAQVLPARDLAFEVEVARRIALRRAWLTAAALVPWAAVGTLLMWTVVRFVGPLAEITAVVLEPTVMALTLAGSGIAGALWLSRRFSEA